MPPERPEDLANIWSHEMDRHGVARAALISSIPGDEESVINAVAAFPERFFAYAMVNPLKWQPTNVDAACLFLPDEMMVDVLRRKHFIERLHHIPSS